MFPVLAYININCYSDAMAAATLKESIALAFCERFYITFVARNGRYLAANPKLATK